jgi:hypothetical protein
MARWVTPLLVLFLTAALPAQAGNDQNQDITMTAIPAQIVSAVAGHWELGPNYHIVLEPAGEGLRVHQEAERRLGGPAVREDAVEYDPQEQILRFRGIGSIHRTVILLRPSPDGLEYAVRSEISPGKWTNHPWEKARRAPAGGD